MTMNELLPQATAQRNFTDIMLSEQARQRWVKYYMIWLLHTSKIYKLIYHTGHQFVMGVGIISEMLAMFCFFGPGTGFTCQCIFFLSHLSFSDFCYSTATGPRTLVGFIAKKWVPFSCYSLQCLIFCTFAESQCLKLVVMAQDGHKASTNPFLFTFPCPAECAPCSWLGSTWWELRMLQ